MECLQGYDGYFERQAFGGEHLKLLSEHSRVKCC